MTAKSLRYVPPVRNAYKNDFLMRISEIPASRYYVYRHNFLFFYIIGVRKIAKVTYEESLNFHRLPVKVASQHFHVP